MGCNETLLKPGSDLSAVAYDDVERLEGATAIMLEGYTYPLYKKLRALDADFVRSVHDKDGINRWVRVVDGNETAAAHEQEFAAMLSEEGWMVDLAAGDASEWESDDDED